VKSIALTDCLWGALDGVNEAGLAIALAFGGRHETGDGFGASLILRYILQTCARVDDAIGVLQRVPVSMAYTFAVLDASGDHATAHTSPGGGAAIDRSRVSTNHQQGVAWPEYARFTQSVERLECADVLMRDHAADTDSLVAAFLRPPLFRTEYARGSGTLYTSVLSGAGRSIDLHWRDTQASAAIGRTPSRTIEIEYAGS
jgi:predicted choloylglycine hydrolase